jgi:hypothetical protein
MTETSKLSETSKLKILHLEDDKQNRNVIWMFFEEYFDVTSTENLQAFQSALGTGLYVAVILDGETPVYKWGDPIFTAWLAIDAVLGSASNKAMIVINSGKSDDIVHDALQWRWEHVDQYIQKWDNALQAFIALIDEIKWLSTD